MDHLVALKGEQTARIVLRDTTLYVFIGSIFGVYAAEAQAAANPDLVQFIRAASSGLSAIMLSIYLSNDYYVSRIGSHVRHSARADDFLIWESEHRRGFLYYGQKIFRGVLIFLLFGGWTAYQIYPSIQHGTLAAKVVSIIFGLVVSFQLLLFVLNYFDERKPEPAAPPKLSAAPKLK